MSQEFALEAFLPAIVQVAVGAATGFLIPRAVLGKWGLWIIRLGIITLAFLMFYLVIYASALPSSNVCIEFFGEGGPKTLGRHFLEVVYVFPLFLIGFGIRLLMAIVPDFRKTEALLEVLALVLFVLIFRVMAVFGAVGCT